MVDYIADVFAACGSDNNPMKKTDENASVLKVQREREANFAKIPE